MHLLILSDSHGRTSMILEAYRKQIKKPDAVVFLGDGLRDLAYADLDLPIYAACGNCDFYSYAGNVRAEDEILITLGGKRILMTHGHLYHVKSSLARLVMTAVKKDVDLVLFGHTHIALEKYLPAGETEYGITLNKPLCLFNPGSVGGYEGSFGTVDVSEKGIVMSHGRV